MGFVGEGGHEAREALIGLDEEAFRGCVVWETPRDVEMVAEGRIPVLLLRGVKEDTV